MKKCLSALLVATMVTAGFAAVNSKAIAETVERGYISVSSYANVELQPDVVEINLAIVTDDSKSLQKAADDNKEVSDKIYEELSALINKDNGDYVKTSNYNASPVYVYKNGKKTISKYEVSNNISVRTKNIQDASKMIDKALLLGATNINGIHFSLSKYDKQCNDLLSIAGKKAHARAAAMAASSGNSILGIRTMNGSCSSSSDAAYPRRLYASNMAMSAKGVDTADAVEEESFTPIKGGVIKINANINASYFVR